MTRTSKSSGLIVRITLLVSLVLPLGALGDGLKVHAAFNYVDRQGQREKKADGTVEMYFQDSYKADIATYKLIDAEIKKQGEGEVLFNYSDPPKGLVIHYDND